MAVSTGHALLLPATAPAARVARGPALRGSEEAPTSAANALGPFPAWSLCAAALVAGSTAASSTRRRGQVRLHRAARAQSTEEQEAGDAVPGLSRAELLRGLGGTAVAGPLGLLAAGAPTPASAKSLNDASQILTSYGLPELVPRNDPPFAWNIVVEPIGLAPDAYYGKFKLGSEPQVVTFNTPPGWVISKPNIDFNGAAGTVQANDYGKGDSATLFVDTAFQGKLDELTKKEYKVELQKALTQKGKGFLSDLKVEKVRDGAPGYKILDYTYDLESGAGFTIARSGIAAVCQVGTGSQLQVFWAAVVTPRWGKMQSDLRLIADSFRVGTVPKGLSTAMIKEFKNMDEAMSASDIPKAI